MASAPPAPDQAPAPALDPIPATASVRPAPSPSPSPSPAPAPPAVEVKEEEVEEKERSWPPPMKMAPYAMYRVFRGISSTAYVGIYVLLYVAQYLSLSAVPERARFWALIYTVMVSMCIAANALIIGVFVRTYMEFDASKQQQQQQAEVAASELLIPPPPEMDMC